MANPFEQAEADTTTKTEVAPAATSENPWNALDGGETDDGQLTTTDANTDSTLVEQEQEPVEEPDGEFDWDSALNAAQVKIDAIKEPMIEAVNATQDVIGGNQENAIAYLLAAITAGNLEKLAETLGVELAKLKLVRGVWIDVWNVVKAGFNAIVSFDWGRVAPVIIFFLSISKWFPNVVFGGGPTDPKAYAIETGAYDKRTRWEKAASKRTGIERFALSLERRFGAKVGAVARQAGPLGLIYSVFSWRDTIEGVSQFAIDSLIDRVTGTTKKPKSKFKLPVGTTLKDKWGYTYKVVEPRDDAVPGQKVELQESGWIDGKGKRYNLRVNTRSEQYFIDIAPTKKNSRLIWGDNSVVPDTNKLITFKLEVVSEPEQKNKGGYIDPMRAKFYNKGRYVVS